MITYEEMVKVKPQVKRPRPILLVGEYGRVVVEDIHINY